MTSFHIANYEFEKRLQDYLNMHGIKMTPEQIIQGVASEDVK